jgi:serine/threonine protein phosphatase PrpC
MVLRHRPLGSSLAHASGEKTAQKVSEKLVKEALKKGSKDNVSVLVVRFCWPGSAV